MAIILLSGISAALFFSVGILGEYVGKLYEQSKDRHLYVASQTYNLGECPAAVVTVHSASKTSV